jgi:G3E family GTPase
MDLLLISGFLGSGKTTLLLSSIDEIIKRRHKKVVIIVNEFGKIGIDGKVMEKYGLEVREMPSGCICCTLGTDLLTTLADVAEAFSPDLVVIEPTGVADPVAIHDTMKLYTGPPIESVRIVIIVDSERYQMIAKAFERSLKNQLKAADAIVMNKMDRVKPGDLEDVENSIRETVPEARIISSSAIEGTNLDQVVSAMVG